MVGFLGRVAPPVGSLVASGLAGALFIITVPGGPSVEDLSEKDWRAVRYQLQSVRAMAGVSLAWTFLSALDLPRGYMPILWAVTGGGYCLTFAYRSLVGGQARL
jgi:hypothetical protein